MFIFLIALIGLIIGVVYFLRLANKKKTEGSDLGEHGRARSGPSTGSAG